MLSVDNIWQSLRSDISDISSAPPNSNEDDIVNQALISAIHAFSARWCNTYDIMNKSTNSIRLTSKAKDRLCLKLWDRARKYIYPIMHRYSYRSSLALYLFGITPTPVSDNDRSISDLCREIALMQIRDIHKSVRFRATGIIHQKEAALQEDGWTQKPSSLNNLSEHTDEVVCASQDSVPPFFPQMFDAAYWFGAVCDISRSLLTDKQAVLLTDNPTSLHMWGLLKDKIEGFDRSIRQTWQITECLSDDIIFSSLQQGSACATLCWGSIIRLIGSLSHHNEIILVEDEVTLCVNEINRFEELFGSLLEKCARDWFFINETNKVSFCEPTFTTFCFNIRCLFHDSYAFPSLLPRCPRIYEYRRGK